MLISTGSWAALSFALGVSSSSGCVADYLESNGKEMIEKLQSIDDLAAFRSRQVVDPIVRRLRCDDESHDELIILGVENPENQRDVLAEAAYLSVKYSGSPSAFIRFLAADFSTFEKARNLPRDKPNSSCSDEFLVLRTWLRRQRTGELLSRSLPVGLCKSDGTFWAFGLDEVWRTIDAAEQARVCVTLIYEGFEGSEYCSYDGLSRE